MKMLVFLCLSFWSCNLFTTPDDSIPPVSETNMKLLWEITYEPAGSGINASPLILGDSLVIMSAGNEIFAVEQNSGKIKWKYKESDVTCSQTEAYATDGFRIYTTQVEDVRAINILDGSQAWIKSLPEERGGFWTNSPSLKNNYLSVSGYHTLYCFNLNSGDTIWSKKIFDRGFISSPVYFNNSVVIGGGYGFDDSNGVIAGTIAKFLSIDLQTGDTMWSVTSKGDGDFIKIVIDEGIIYGGTYFTWSSGSFEARDAVTGELKWSYFTSNEPWSYRDCIVAGDKIIVNSGLGNHVFAFNKHTGQLLWRISLQGDPLQEKQCYYNSYVYITQGWKLYVLNPENGEVVYSLKPKGRDLVTIAVGNGKVFVCGYPTLQCYEVYKP